MKRVHLYSILVVLTIIAIIIGVLLSSFSWKDKHFNLEQPVVLSENWDYKWTDTGEKGTVSLPARVEGGKANRELRISNTLPEGSWSNPHLFIEPRSNI
jgi:hypothetical protein